MITIKNTALIVALFLNALSLVAQQKSGQLTKVRVEDEHANAIDYELELSPVILNDKIAMASLIKRLREDTTFEKCFKNLNVLSYNATVVGKMLTKKDKIEASINSSMSQEYKDGCATKKIISERTTGKLKKKNGEWIYHTCKFFGNLFLEPGTVCGKDNIIAGKKHLSPKEIDKIDGIEKRVEQVKLLVFNPGKKIPGLFYFGNKVAIFEKDAQKNYDFFVDKVNFRGRECIILKITAKEDLGIFRRADIVIDELTTWLDAKTWEIVGKRYLMSYNMGIVSFDIKMEVDVAKYKEYLHPTVIRYSGKWNMPFYRDENGFFTVFLSSFKDDKEDKK